MESFANATMQATRLDTSLQTINSKRHWMLSRTNSRSLCIMQLLRSMSLRLSATSALSKTGPELCMPAFLLQVGDGQRGDQNSCLPHGLLLPPDWPPLRWRRERRSRGEIKDVDRSQECGADLDARATRVWWRVSVSRRAPTTGRAIDRTDLLTDERFADMAARSQHAAEAVAILDEAFATAPRDEWVRRLREARGDFIFTIVNSVADLPEDPQVKAIITTMYQSVPEFAVAVPTEMQEEYRLPNGSGGIGSTVSLGAVDSDSSILRTMSSSAVLSRSRCRTVLWSRSPKTQKPIWLKLER